MAFAAQTGGTPQLAWLIFGAALIWATIYDTFYAMVDRDDDLKIGVKSTAILFGDLDLFVIGGLQFLMMMALLLAGKMAQLGVWYYASLGLAALLMIWHQWLARERDREGCFKAFLHNHYIGLVIFAGIIANYTFVTPAP
jgi:4-hydroxybenzoate polyprenyltransferase